MTQTLRLLPLADADGPRNMALDETLLHSAVTGTASLRFYTWSAPTVSLGYFQPAQIRATDALLAVLPWVRRPSGGQTLVHHHELTYALALPAGSAWQRGHSAAEWLTLFHRILAAALQSLGAATELHAQPCAGCTSVLCFHSLTPGDVSIGGAKIVGSAQRRHGGALLQHGAVLLAQSAYTPSLPGIRELTGIDVGVAELCDAITSAMAERLSWTCSPSGLTEAEAANCEHLVAAKYAAAGWNGKR